MNASAEGFDQSLNVRKNNGRGCRPAEDSGQSFPMLGIHWNMLSLGDSNRNRANRAADLVVVNADQLVDSLRREFTRMPRVR